MTDLLKSIEITAKRFPNKTAIIFNQENVTYSDLIHKISILTAHFANNGIRYQDKVAIFLDNNPFFVTAFFALAKIGAVAITLNVNYKEQEIRSYLKEMSVKYLILDKRPEKGYSRCRKATYGTGIKLIINSENDYLGSYIKRLDSNTLGRVSYDDEVLRQFSSGSTGKPKLVGRSHLNIHSEAKSVYETIGISNKDRILCAVPLFHAYGFGSALLPSLYSGATIILLNKFNPRQILNTLRKEKVTIFFAVPYMFSILADILKKRVKIFSLRYCFSAGISLPAEVSKRFYRKFGVFVRDLYGTTETGCISVNLNEDIETTLDSVGLPIEGANIKIILQDCKRAKKEQVGEIAVKTPTCGKWYYINNKKDPLLKKKYFHTGDTGKKDRKGNLYILGRKTSFINVAGTKVDPKEVEGVLKEFSRVKEVVVLGASDKLRGEIVKAIIVPENIGLNKSAILKYCRERLADFKVPRIVEFRDRLPKNPLGKILKGYL